MSNWRKLFNKSSTPSSSTAGTNYSSSVKSQTATPVSSVPQNGYPAHPDTTHEHHQQQQQQSSHQQQQPQHDESSHVVLGHADNSAMRDSRRTLVAGDMSSTNNNSSNGNDESIAMLSNEVGQISINEDTINKNLEDMDPVLIDDSNVPAKPLQTNNSSLNLKPGLLTIKVYSGKSIVVPCPIKSDKSILSKLVTLGSNINYDEMIKNIDSLSGSYEEDSDKVTNCVPATLQINNNPGTGIDNGNGNGINRNSVTTYHLVYLVLEVESSSDRISSIGGTIANPKFNSVSTFDITNPNTCQLRLHLYVRIPSGLTDESSQANSQNDLLVGSCTMGLTEGLNMNDIKNSSSFRILNHEWKKLYNLSLSSDELFGLINITLDYKTIQQSKKSLSIDDFDLLKVIGKGSFGKVMQVRKKDTGKIYALKAIRKSHIVNKMEVVHTLAEKFVLSRVTSPFIVPLKFAFQSNEKLYLVLSFINGGELFYHIQQEVKFSLVRSKMYICELISAIENLHEMNIIYRDLKPENILIDESGHIALCDFGLCKINMKLDQKTKTFCGTPEYLAPELLSGKGYTRVVDFWTLGILLYEMLTGLPPFYDENVSIMYQKILNDPLTFPSYITESAKSLMIGLLNRDPLRRLGANGVEEIKSHCFFADIDWNILNNKGYIPPYRPNVKDISDTSNISPEFTGEFPKDSVANDYLSESIQRQFAGWTYNPGNSFNDI